ncbi:MAG: hypothetical protein K6G88_11210 [Lachnospiraceae bacterium]|nr:hypothetical protein [Lachnospiraceae bacterium]
MNDVNLASLCFDRIIANKEKLIKNESMLRELKEQYVAHLIERGVSKENVYDALLINGLADGTEEPLSYVEKLYIDSNDITCVEYYNRFDYSNTFCRICPFSKIDNNQFGEYERKLLLFSLYKEENANIVAEFEKEGPIFNYIATDELFLNNKYIQPLFTLPFNRLFFDNVIMKKIEDNEFIELITRKYGDMYAARAYALQQITCLRMEVAMAARTPLSKNVATKYAREIHDVFGRSIVFPPAGLMVTRKKKKDIKQESFEQIINDTTNTALSSNEQETVEPEVTKEESLKAVEQTINDISEQKEPDPIETVEPKEYDDEYADSIIEENISELWENSEPTDNTTDNNDDNAFIPPGSETVEKQNSSSLTSEPKDKSDCEDNSNEDNNEKSSKVEDELYTPFQLINKDNLALNKNVINLGADKTFYQEFENGLLNDEYMVCELIGTNSLLLLFYVQSVKKHFIVPLSDNALIEQLIPYFKRKKFSIYTSTPWMLIFALSSKKKVVPRGVRSIYCLYEMLYPEQKMYSLRKIIEESLNIKLSSNDNILLQSMMKYKQCYDILLKQCQEQSLENELSRRELSNVALGISMNRGSVAGGSYLLLCDKSGKINIVNDVIEKKFPECKYFSLSIEAYEHDGNISEQLSNTILDGCIAEYVENGKYKTCPLYVIGRDNNSLQLYSSSDEEYNYVFENMVVLAKKFSKMNNAGAKVMVKSL